jgi:hypothetical protein
MQAEIPEEGRQHYRRHVVAVVGLLKQRAADGLEPERVATVVEQALTVARPRARYTIGSDARLIALATRLLPDGLRDAFVRREFGL